MPFTPRESTPETQPAGARWTPPGLPPAPPGGGTGGPPGGGSFRRGGESGEPNLVAELHPLLNDLAVSGTTFATLECYPDDPRLRSELISIIEEARDNLLRQLDALLERIATEQPPFSDDALRGWRSSLLSSPKPFRPFSLIARRSREALVAMPPREFAVLVLEHFKAAVQDEARYYNRPVFETEVYNNFQSLLFAAQIASLDG